MPDQNYSSKKLNRSWKLVLIGAGALFVGIAGGAMDKFFPDHSAYIFAFKACSVAILSALTYSILNPRKAVVPPITKGGSQMIPDASHLLSGRQINVMNHALAYPKLTRNGFVALMGSQNEATWLELVAMGLAAEKTDFERPEHRKFVVVEKGIEVLKAFHAFEGSKAAYLAALKA